MQKPPSVRWVAVVLCIVYGFAKLNGSQFTVLDSELTKPLGEVSGFWLTWYYFGYSSFYGSLIALVQIAGAILLAWPRTALVGAVVLGPVFANIILINLFFGIDLGATVVAVVIFSCLLAVIAPHADRLKAVLLLDPISRRARLRLAALAVILVGAFGFTWWAANYHNRLPTAIDGIWSVVPEPDEGGAHPRWRQVFFERNRAHWVTFRAADGTDERHHFEIDEQGVVRIWQTWLTKGPLIMQGSVARDGRLQLEPVEAGGGRRMVLRRQGAVERPRVEPDVMVIQAYNDGLSGVRATNPDVHLSIGRDPFVPNEPVLFVEYPAPSDNPAGRDVQCDAEQQDWTAGRAISFQVRSDHPLRLSVSFLDRNRVAYTTWTELKGGVWQAVGIPFDEMRPNPYFQPPDAKTGAPIDVSEVKSIAFAPQDRTAGRLTISRFVLSK